jgi:nucleotide-binding universal stress UspA family protein
VVQGNPAPTIAEYAERYGYDAIVMPTHGREGIQRRLLGSVTEKVIRLSSTPVLTVRMTPEEQLEFPYERLLLPTDGSDAALRAAEHGIDLADSLDATVHVLSVVEAAEVPAVPGLGFDSDGEGAAREAVAAVESLAVERGVSDTVEHVERGDPVEEILDVVDAAAIHAVVMGTTGRRGSDRILLGSVAERTVRTAPVPVITVRDGG